MNRIDFTPLYRNSVGFDRLASLLDQALNNDSHSSGYPPYDIEVLDENRYDITLAVAGFEEDDITIQIENGILTINGKKPSIAERNFLYNGIAHREFERKFNLADYVEVKGADLRNGLLKIHLEKEIPEAMKPRTISINRVESNSAIEHQQEKAA